MAVTIYERIPIFFCTEVGSTVAASAGFLLVAFSVVGTSGALLPLLFVSSSLLTFMKLIQIKSLANRKIKSSTESDKEIYTALQKKEVGTVLALGTTTIGAGILTTQSGASAIASVGILCPALSLAALGFAINALVEFYDNVCQWRERVNKEGYYTQEEIRSGLKGEQIAAARNLAISSFVKLLGWSCVITGGYMLAAPFAPWLIASGLALVTGSHLYNSFFSVPRVSVYEICDTDDGTEKVKLPDSFNIRVIGNNCRGKKECVWDGQDIIPNNVRLQLL
ncbi:MAG: hypothetical protein K0R24_1716 [Gammaproteobacteria bacterium]|nr:hypothetical protein [Gammaproteobacteria bacterium]